MLLSSSNARPCLPIIKPIAEEGRTSWTELELEGRKVKMDWRVERIEVGVPVMRQMRRFVEG